MSRRDHLALGWGGDPGWERGDTPPSGRGEGTLGWFASSSSCSGRWSPGAGGRPWVLAEEGEWATSGSGGQ